MQTVSKIDLHVHSSFSDQPYSWFLKTTKAAECYTTPERVYETATRRGMDLVTLTDHDTINGALELVERHDNAFISEEVSGRFPEDGCVIHIIAMGLTEASHAELQRLRGNVYELVAYMVQQNIPYFWCHPLAHVNGRLTRAHIERSLLMFRVLEGLNGTRDASHEQRLRQIVANIDAGTIERWSERYPQVPVVNADGRYAFVGGSDDHGGLAIARAYTTFDRPATPDALLAALRAGDVAPSGEAGTAETLAHNCYGVAAGYLKSSGQLSRAAPNASLLTTLSRHRSRLGGTPELSADQITERGHTTEFSTRLHAAANAALIGGWRETLSNVGDALGQGRLADVADGVSEIVKATLMELPYVLAGRYHVRDRKAAERFALEFSTVRHISRGPRVAVLTDTVDHVNGVAIGLRALHAAANHSGFELELVATGERAETYVDDDGIVRIPSIYRHRLAEYPEIPWSVPHFPSLMSYVADANIDLVQCSTPGPLGFSGLLAGALTGTRVIGQFHTDLPEYAMRMTGDPTIAAIVRAVVGWFYRSMDTVFAPSDWIADLLVRDLGVAPSAVRRIPRGIELDRFGPHKRDLRAFERFGVSDEPKILYVGRISREKGLRGLVEGFQSLAQEHPTAHLVLVGDGPYRAELEREFASGRISFLGQVTGDVLSVLYASADLFAFPSETETFGNAVIEAQASGLPVIVAETGAARENILEGVTGLTVRFDEPGAFHASAMRILREPALRRRMSRAAEGFARRYDIAEAVRGTFAEYERVATEMAPPRDRALDLAS